MLDRMPNPGHEGRVIITPEGGGAPYYAKIQMADNPAQVGTPLNKANLFDDTTAALFGLTEPNATPNMALAHLFNSKVKKTIILPSGVDLNTVVESGFYRLQASPVNIPSWGGAHGQLIVSRGADTITQILFSYYGGEVACRSSPGVGATMPNVGWIDVLTSGMAVRELNSVDTATFNNASYPESYVGYAYEKIGALGPYYMNVMYLPFAGGYSTQVAFLKDGSNTMYYRNAGGGNWVAWIKVITDQNISALRSQNYTRVGTGATSYTLNFNFKPSVVVIQCLVGTAALTMTLIYPSPRAGYIQAGTAATITWGTNSITIDGNGYANLAMNETGVTYYITALA